MWPSLPGTSKHLSKMVHDSCELAQSVYNVHVMQGIPMLRVFCGAPNISTVIWDCTLDLWTVTVGAAVLS